MVVHMAQPAARVQRRPPNVIFHPVRRLAIVVAEGRITAIVIIQFKNTRQSAGVVFS